MTAGYGSCCVLSCAGSVADTAFVVVARATAAVFCVLQAAT